MRNYKKYLAATLAAVMTLGTSVTAMAATTLATPSVSATPSDITDKDTAQGTLGGNGSVAGIVDKNVFHVVVPAIADADKNTYYDFILDPQGLINKTQGASFGAGVDYDATAVRTLYFRNIPAADGGDPDLAGSIYDYSNVSQGFQVTNKSTMAVDVSFKAELKNLNEGITLAANDTFKDSENKDIEETSIYMGIKKDADAAVAVAAGGTTVPAALTAAPANAYKESYTEDGGFAYALDPAATGVNFSKTVFKLTGACNPNGDWVAFKDKTVAPKLEVTWKVVEHTNGPKITTTTYAYENKDLAINVDLGSGDDAATGIASITFMVSGAPKTVAAENYTFSNNVLTMKTALFGFTDASRTFKITFNDKAKTAIDVTVTK